MAQRLDLPNRYDFLEVPRDDGGPLLRRYRPGAQFTTQSRDHDAVQTVVYDEDGFCNPDGHEGAAEQVEIIVLGDFFTDCNVPPEQTWAALLQPIRAGAPTIWAWAVSAPTNMFRC